MVSVGIFNTIALVVFSVAFCWRLDQIRKHGGGFQAIALTVSIAALVIAFVSANGDVVEAIDTLTFTGAARVVFYAMLSLGVAALILVFFFPSPGDTRKRRIGFEAVPLVVSLIGLQATMLVTPLNLRIKDLTEWNAQNIAFGLFFLIASFYLGYGFISCIRSIRQFLRTADGYLKVSLSLLAAGLALLAISSITQILFVVFGMTSLAQVPWLMRFSQVAAVVGVVLFLMGICYPMVYGKWQAFRSERRRTRDDAELVPLWKLVTGAVPEVVLPGAGKQTATERYHRRIVETRDALTQLSPYLSEDFEIADDDTRVTMLYDAVDSYVAYGKTTGDVRDMLPAEGEGIDADAAPLVRMSRIVALDQQAMAQSAG
ncbi:hypothetical protein GII35_23430 [Gordonia amarae]|nr:hypothetical protein GII35_23430 [Gordonia amarae]